MSPSRQHTYACPVQLTIDIVGGKWKPLILWLLKGGRPRRFNDLQRAMPDVAHKVLIQQLRQLERDGLVSRTVVSEPHLQVEYCLTAFGTSLGPVLNEMAAWAKRHHRRFGATLGPLK
jgi:DNA-binding HxlR family transcriptional regulator